MAVSVRGAGKKLTLKEILDKREVFLSKIKQYEDKVLSIESYKYRLETEIVTLTGRKQCESKESLEKKIDEATNSLTEAKKTLEDIRKQFKEFNDSFTQEELVDLVVQSTFSIPHKVTNVDRVRKNTEITILKYYLHTTDSYTLSYPVPSIKFDVLVKRFVEALPNSLQLESETRKLLLDYCTQTDAGFGPLDVMYSLSKVLKHVKDNTIIIQSDNGITEENLLNYIFDKFLKGYESLLKFESYNKSFYSVATNIIESYKYKSEPMIRSIKKEPTCLTLDMHDIFRLAAVIVHCANRVPEENWDTKFGPAFSFFDKFVEYMLGKMYFRMGDFPEMKEKLQIFCDRRYYITIEARLTSLHINTALQSGTHNDETIKIHQQFQQTEPSAQNGGDGMTLGGGDDK